MNPLILFGGLALLVFASGGKKGGAADLAKKLAADIRARQYDYSRPLAKSFQKAAGLTADGIYGPSTATAVGKYTTAPKALFAGAGAKKKAAKKKPAPKVKAPGLATAP